MLFEFCFGLESSWLVSLGLMMKGRKWMESKL